MKALRDYHGIPICVAQGDVVLTSVKKESKTPKPSQSGSNSDKVTVGDYTVASWGSDNNWPSYADKCILQSTVLRPGLEYLIKIICGQGIMPVYITGYNNDGSEIIKPVNKPELISFLEGRMIRRYLYKATRDIIKYGSAFPELIPDSTYKSFYGIDIKDAPNCRLEHIDKNGIINNVLYSGFWPDANKENTTVIKRLDVFDPVRQVKDLADKGLLKQNYIYPLCDEFDIKIHYPFPGWFTAEESGWLEISRQIPDFIRNMYKNQASFKYHIEVPYEYWEMRFPSDKYKNEKERLDLIDSAIDDIIKSVTDTKNANKAILTHYSTGPDGKPTGIIIKEFSNKWSTENLMTSAIANSEILSALGINPAVRGMMPGSSVYAGNQGGSNIREAHLIDVALAFLMQQTIMDPIELLLTLRGEDPAIQLRFRKTFLTTLDTGAGTGKVLS